MKTAILTTLTLIFAGFVMHNDFLTEQKKYERVQTAFQEKEQFVTDKLKEQGLKPNDLNILLVAYKDDDKLELYAKKKSDSRYKLLDVYDICARSGKLGPKRQEGDLQVPEGFYYINVFNPKSDYYLSLGINYPNASDSKKSKAKKLGGEIFIHGRCVTIGCLPMTDEKIKEIYLYAVFARNNGQMKIPVYIFPFKMTEKNLGTHKIKYADKALIDFWINLKTGFVKFEKEKKELNVNVDKNGNYIF